MGLTTRHPVLGVVLLLLAGLQWAATQTSDLQDDNTEDNTIQGSSGNNNNVNNTEVEDAGSGLLLGGGLREGHFPGGQARVELPVTLSLRGYTSLSFRTCSHGTILKQTGDEGDGMEVRVSSEGSLVLTLTRNDHPHSLSLGRNLNDNTWHRFYLRFELGVLRLGVDQATVVVANTSEPTYLDLNLWSSAPRLILGHNYTGCLLQGAGTELTSYLARHTGIIWGRCPLPDGTDCDGGGYEEDPCFSQPCGQRGECEATPEGYICNCYTRYSGLHCQEDLGPLCVRPEFQCQNGGLCQEDRQGNTTSCACPIGYTGTYCHVTIDESFCLDESNPCQNNATCSVTSFSDTYECRCLAGFSGEHCETNDDDCASQPCLHGGLCQDGIRNYTCNCAGTGYEGMRCEENIDECALLIPCQNGATCYDLYGDYECACIPGYSGKHCELEVEECSSDPCQNGGTCTELHNSYRCACLLGFEGDNCEHNINDCYNITCPDNSYCMDGVNEYACRCMPGFSGSPPNCVQINECDSSPCLNGASCYDEDNSFTCICAPGFSGNNCEENIDDCQPDPCQNGGTCQDGVNTYTCLCLSGFEGHHCQDNRNECALNVCLHATNCRDTGFHILGDYDCECEDGWTGKNCDEELDECVSAPCLNGATCKDRLNGFDCTCPPGFTGEMCETNIDECLSAPCQNGGQCVDGVNSFNCECGEAFMGEFCEEEYDACVSSPCHNGASCITTLGQQDFYCECIPGFEGLFCSNNINDCFDVVCADGKVCHDLVNSYECRCPEGFTGHNCSVDVDECESQPCLNGGECHDGRANYTCVCPPGYTGHNCENDVDECELLRPCVNGICENTNGSYQCYCRPGFSGDHCNLEFDECLSRPCHNAGTCINRINGYSCLCAPGYTGVDCDVDIDECESSPCQNNATCHDHIAAFTCECRPGFTDELCATNIDECESDPCMNGGVCTDGINEYTCNCTDTGFKGPQCEVNIDDCESSPCQHGSTCTDLVKDYSCFCHSGYEGKNCEEDIEECALSPCLNGASCLERSNLTLYELDIFTNFTYENAGGFVCECVPGFTGDNCEINIDECESNPCVNGVCYDGIDAYTCDCWPGYKGINCELEINECELYQPCVYGSCVDKVADYECVCEDGYGGKNCSVELVGCLDVECENGGSCEALLMEDEETHGFLCHCPYGFTDRTCHSPTTLSLGGSSYVLINSNRQEGYELSFRFRTTLADGILAVGQGETYIKLELYKGQLNFHSSLLNKWEGIFTGSDLNNGDWHSVKMAVNDSHVLLAANDDVTIYPINPVQTINSSDTSFSTTVLGGATPTLKILSKGAPFFTGCMQDVEVDGSVLVPSVVPEPMRVLVEEGCPRVEQCNPNPCLNGGECIDLWTSYQCNCQRPYLGETCELSFTPVTFGNELARDSLVTVAIPEVDHGTYRTHADVSMLVRTRQSDGLIFYLGTIPDDPAIPGSRETHILAELKNGDLVIRLLLDGPEEIFTIRGLQLTDGIAHLLHVKRIGNELEVRVDSSTVLNTTLAYGGDLQAHVLYLGGIPEEPATFTRKKRQLGVSNFTTTITRPHFKGTLQDIRVSNGSETRLVQPFPLTNVSSVVLPGLDFSGVVTHNVLEGTVSDDTCAPDPCLNGATCTVTWNDFECTCTVGYKGKTCDEREYCAIYQCPPGAECVNLDDGYECLANLTLNGLNSSVSFVPSFTRPPPALSKVLLTYRSQVGGTVMYVAGGNASVQVSLHPGLITVYQANGSVSNSASFFSNSTLDGDWHTLTVSLHPTGLQVLLDNTTLLGTDIAVIIDFTFLVLNGEVMVGSSRRSSSGVGEMFRGCLGPSRIQSVLLPFFSQLDLINNTAQNQFLRMAEDQTRVGCTLCYNEECINGGFCSDPAEVYSCSCPAGFEGTLCQVNIDECINNQCLNGATCIDGVNEYTCACFPGYTGEFCQEDINECASDPCQNGGTCTDRIGRFECSCLEEYVGITCAELKVKNCSRYMCLNGATCNDVFNPLTGIADNYTCTCAFGYEGINCERAVDFCKLKNVDCHHGTCDLTFKDSGWECICDAGWEKPYCMEETNECNSQPCYNGATCIDKHINFTCECPPSWKGRTCQEDVDECEKNPCQNGGTCFNLQGSFECGCYENYCGQTCNLSNPCLGINCTNGECIYLCDEDHANEIDFFCQCEDDWEGDFCLVKSFSNDLNLAIIVGCVVTLMLIIAIVGLTVFLMMAKKKRQTRGTYSPSRQEFYSPRVEMGNVMKPPPEERLI